MPIPVSDISGNRSEKIANAAKVLGKSRDRKRVFMAIYTGKKSIKTVNDIMRLADLNRVRALQEAGKLASEDIITQLDYKIDGKTAYKKIRFYEKNKKIILSLASNKKKLNKYPTKSNPRINIPTIKVSFPKNIVKIKSITIDDIDSFSKVKQIDISKDKKNVPFYEKDIKEGIKKILNEEGDFTDWGGETDDMFSTRVILNGKRLNAAIGLKGRGTKGILTPKKMGANGDQIQRLFKSPANIFLVQYWGQIDESVIDQMKSIATAKSVSEGEIVYFGVIDGRDTLRLCEAYRDFFETNQN
jgi:hypothetical protein